MIKPSDVKIQVVIPTAINLVLMVSENISSNLRLGQAANLQLMSIYKRAYMAVGETDEIAVLRLAKPGT